MKNTFLILIIIGLLFSCSNDDSNNNDSFENNNEATFNIILIDDQIITLQFDSGFFFNQDCGILHLYSSQNFNADENSIDYFDFELGYNLMYSNTTDWDYSGDPLFQAYTGTISINGDIYSANQVTVEIISVSANPIDSDWGLQDNFRNRQLTATFSMTLINSSGSEIMLQAELVNLYVGVSQGC